MKKCKISPATLARTAALALALTNQVLSATGHRVLPIESAELEQGLLTGKVTMETTFPEGSTRNSNPSFQPARRKQALDLLAKWGDLTGKYDCTMAQLVIALTARMIPGLHVLCGARTPEQVLDNAGALNIKLDGADAVRMKWDVDAIS